MLPRTGGAGRFFLPESGCIRVTRFRKEEPSGHSSRRNAIRSVVVGVYSLQREGPVGAKAPGVLAIYIPRFFAIEGAFLRDDE